MDNAVINMTAQYKKFEILKDFWINILVYWLKKN